MIRFVVGPDRAIVPDLAGRLPGRGLWLSARSDVLEAARTRSAFARAARGPVTVPADLSATIGAALTRRIAEFVGLARRSGQAVGGFQKARDWLREGRAALLVQAFDASPDERARLAWPNVPVATPLSSQALGAVFGRDHVMYVAVAPGRLAETILVDSERLAGVAGRDAASKSQGWASGAAGRDDMSPGAIGRDA